jgi:hypothetical protein
VKAPVRPEQIVGGTHGPSQQHPCQGLCRPPAEQQTQHLPGGARRRAAGRPPLTPRKDTPISHPHAHRQFLNHLDGYIREAKKNLDAWNVYSGEHTDLDGWPYDDHAYGLCRQQRDAGTAAAFENLRAGDAQHLLDTADAQLPLIPASGAQTRWIYQLGVLRDALDRLNTLHEEWLRTRESLPPDARAGTNVFDAALAELHTACMRRSSVADRIPQSARPPGRGRAA